MHAGLWRLVQLLVLVRAFWPLIPLALMFAGVAFYPLFIIGVAWWSGFCLLCLVRSLRRQQG
jgi:hypothetical protein